MGSHPPLSIHPEPRVSPLSIADIKLFHSPETLETAAFMFLHIKLIP